ncbi:MAG: hypothetical protein HOL72_06435 [Euryarchaeota archaeon]|jgi:hypothetical protein|nr:hypothetical protein [Euryarchaeota archaeon]MBT5255384.1 hypothetical protein [Euryarchaeota archaeon]MDG1546405.1 hypothetical protein [Candidatus Poseidoniaceae archaeon]
MEQIFQCTSDEYFSKVIASFNVDSGHSIKQFTVRKGRFRSVEVSMTPMGDELVVQYKPLITKLGLVLSIIISIIVATTNLLFLAVTFVALFFIQIAFSSQLTWEILQATQSTISLRDSKSV